MSQTLRAVAYLSPREAATRAAFDRAVLRHDERRVRRRLIALTEGSEILVDFPAPLTLADRSGLALEDGRVAEVVAADEPLLAVRGRDSAHLMRLCWHLGNRHLKTQIDRDRTGPRLLVLRDHVVAEMLRGLGAEVMEVSEPFDPEEGAYSHSHGEPAHALLNR